MKRNRCRSARRHGRLPKWCLCLLLVFLTPTLDAGESLFEIPPVRNAPTGSPGLGAALRMGTSPYKGTSDTVDIVPLYLYEGKYLFSYGTSAGAHLYRSDFFSLDFLFRYRFTELDPTDDLFLQGLRERRQSVDAGLSGAFRGRLGEVKLEWVTDTLDRHKGQEFDLEYRYRFERGNWQFSPFATLIWQDSDLTGYYYGVTPAEARPDRPAYSPGSALNLEFGINSSLQLTDHVFMFGNIGVATFDDAIADSPLVDSQTNLSAFLGAGYMFGNGTRKYLAQPEREGEWSWRINYGYQAEENIFPYLMAGLIKGSEDVDSTIGGFTVGKLFQSGRRADFWGKLAVYRHFEDLGQDDFWSFAALMQAMGKGYLPWSKLPAFRYGFGFGVSYAQEVPIAEQIKQAGKGEETNRLLNYMEFQVDFPIDRLIKSKMTRNCYVGMLVVHRSGMFESSSMLNDVGGGSDWVTLSLECIR